MLNFTIELYGIDNCSLFQINQVCIKMVSITSNKYEGYIYDNSLHLLNGTLEQCKAEVKKLLNQK